MQRVVATVHHVVRARFRDKPAGVVVHRISLAFYCLYGFWRSKVYLSDVALAAAKEVQQTFAQAWKSTSWVPRTWVHLVACHSGVFLSRYPSLYMFSTIPTEKKKSAIKLDLGHLFRGWSITGPICTRWGLLHLVNNHALDLGLLLQGGQRDGTEIQMKKKTKRPNAAGDQ